MTIKKPEDDESVQGSSDSSTTDPSLPWYNEYKPLLILAGIVVGWLIITAIFF